MNVIAKDVQLPDEPSQATAEPPQPPPKPVMDVRPPQTEAAASSAVHEAPPESDGGPDPEPKDMKPE